jgi:uncharacterized protein (DUF58 family)
MMVAGGALTVAAGRVFGVLELYLLGTALLLAAIGAVIAVRFRPVRLRIARRVTPNRVHAGDTARVELAVANRTRLRQPLLVLRDPVSNTRGARLQLAPMAAGETARASYRLPTQARGQLTIGPLRLERTDALGLATREAIAAAATTVTVLPKWYPVAVPGAGVVNGPLGQHLRMRALARSGDEFRSLRDYAPGDDLRRISWRASARSENLKVRENESSGSSDLTVVLDLGAAGYDEPAFERAVSAATSIVVSAAERGRAVRFLTTGGFEHATGTVGADLLLEYLAGVQPIEGAGIDRIFGQLNTRSSGGLLVAVTGAATAGVLGSLRNTPSADAVVVVATAGPVPASRAGLFVVDASVDDAFPAAWNLLTGSGGAVDHRSARPAGAIVLGEAFA